jgi:FAD/FMN-containing dehydrogenase
MNDCRTRHTFSNWSHTLEFKPRQFCKPRTEARIVEIVTDARDRRGCVRTQGAGHSFSQLLATDDTLVSLDDLDQSLRVSGTEVTVSAGIRLKDLVKRLADRGLALKNLGSVTEQSIAGAISTGTHGTGLTLGSLSTQVIEARLVAGDASVVSLTRDDPRLKAACLSLGALGIITELTLACVPHYRLEYDAYVGKFDDVMASLGSLTSENVRVLIWWLVPFFDRDDVVIITKNPPGHPAGLLGSAEDRVRRPFGIQHTPLGRGVDALWNAIAGQGLGGGTRLRKIWHMEGDYDDMLTIPLLPVFHTESEYAVPHVQAAAALTAFRHVVEENDFRFILPVEVRFTAGDDIHLSPGNRGPACYIGASPSERTAEVFARFEPLMREHGGRPHWGKHFTLTRADIRSMYGASYDAFVSVRDALDPDRVFSNSLLESVLG